MANHEYKILSEDAIKYLCGLIRDLASVSEGIDNLNLADDKTFSNIYIKNLIDKCLEDANAEAEKLVGALTHLTCEETAIQPTLDNSEINVIYLYSANGNPPYQQFLKISEDKLVDLGSTSISLEDYIKAADVAKDYATKVELKAVTDKIGTTTLTTTDTTITGAIEEVKGIADDKVDKADIATTIDSTSTDSKVTSAKAVWNKSKNKIQRLLDGADIIVYADSISNEMVTDTVRIMNATNSPYGVDNVNNDFYYTIYNINDDKYKRILAYDIRKNDMYMIIKNNNIWGTWAKLATMDKVKDGYAKIIKNNDTDTNDAMFIAYKNSDLFGIRIYKDDNSEHELKFSASGISYVKDGVTIWTK